MEASGKLLEELARRDFSDKDIQALMLRGSRDFADVAAYGLFLETLTKQLNRGREARFAEELQVLRGLPPLRVEAVKRLEARVDCGSLIHVVRTLLDGSFVDRKENVLVFGNPGAGKSHLLCAIGQELARAGRRVYFSSTNLLVQELLLAKRELRLPRAIKKLSGYAALILDDLGYVQQNREEMEVLFTLLAERYERGSVLITSNLPFSKWELIFKDAMTTAAAIDRLVHHSVILELNLPSYRVEQARKSKAAAAAATTPGEPPAAATK